MSSLEGKKIAFIVDNNFEQVEYTGPRDRFEAAGATTELLALSEREVQGLNHVDKADTFSVDRLLTEADPAEYDAVVFPGGTVNADTLRRDSNAQQWLETFDDEDKPVALICHAPWLLVSSGRADDATLTSFPTLQDDVRNAGGTWVDEEVVVDGNFITSRNPDDIPAFSDAIIKALNGTPDATDRDEPLAVM